MAAAITRVFAVSASSIIWPQSSSPAVVSRPMRKRPTTAASERLQGRGNYKKVGYKNHYLRIKNLKVLDYFLDDLFMGQVAAVDCNIRPFLV